MKVKFTAENFNKIVKLCGNVCAKKSDRRPVLEHICLDISYDQCIAVGVNGYELVKCDVECESEETGRILLMPVKLPRQATHVEIETDAHSIRITATYYGTTLRTDIQNVCEAEYINYKFIVPEPYERTQYSISVNPQYMMQIMKAMSDYDSVKLSFGSAVQGILITPNYEPEGSVVGTLLPVRA